MAQQIKTSLDFVMEGKIINLPDGVDLQDAATVNQLKDGTTGFPDQTGNGGKYLKTNGTTVSWQFIDRNIDGGFAAAVYLSIQKFDGGGA